MIIPVYRFLFVVAPPFHLILKYLWLAPHRCSQQTRLRHDPAGTYTNIL